MKKTNTTIAEVSRLSGVSTATVSRVLNQTGNVRPATVAKVMKAVEALSYQLNPVASSLASGRSKTVGVVLPHLDNQFFIQVLDSAEEKLTRAGFSMMLATTGNEPARERQVISQMLAFKVAGILIATSLKDASYFESVNQSCPVVLIDRRVPETKVDMISEENLLEAKILMQALTEKGHRKIGVFTGHMDLNLMEERLEGSLLAAPYSKEKMISNQYIVRCRNTVRSGKEEALKAFSLWKEHGQMPTAVTILNNYVAEGVMLAAREMNISIPDELSLVCFGPLRSPLIEPQITMIAQNGLQMGELAGQQLVDRILQGNRKNSEPPCDIILQNRIKEGNSVKQLSFQEE